MRKLLETMYVLTPESYLYHRNENICISVGGEERASVVASQVDSIVLFGKNTFSTSLIGFCSEHGISVVFLDANGRFYGRVCGPVSGNVLLRKRQYESLHDEAFTLRLIRDMLFGKIRNAKGVLVRHARSAKEEAAAQAMTQAAGRLSGLAQKLSECEDAQTMRGIEGTAASQYFACFDHMLSSPSGLRFESRSRHPPRNEVNAALSFVYVLLTHRMTAALEAVGLDPAAGYLHTLRPGRPSLALDLMEELRAPLCDRLVLTLMNRGQLTRQDFDRSTQAVALNDRGRKTVLAAWRERSREEIQHPFLQEKVPIGLIPYTQAMLLARVLRGDLDRYPPFIWR